MIINEIAPSFDGNIFNVRWHTVFSADYDCYVHQGHTMMNGEWIRAQETSQEQAPTEANRNSILNALMEKWEDMRGK